MDTRRIHRRIAGLAAVLALLLGTRPGATSTQDAKRAPCCYANTRYAGVCKVEAAPGETCAGILAYLNNPKSAGKTYCGSTDIRGGWTRVKCKG